jgi:outer membrane lipoprotein-sorting protein
MAAIIFAIIICNPSLEPLTEKLESIGYLTGSFVQTDYWALTLDSGESCGTLHLAHPNLFMLEYSDYPGRATGCTGDTVYTVDPEFSEILVYTGTPTGFLHILSLPEEGLASTVYREEGDSLTVVISGEFDGGITEITAGYTMSDSLPYFLSTLDANGNSTSWELANLSVHRNPPDVFKIPDLSGYATVDAGSI